MCFMIVSVKSLLNLYQFPTGRRLYCLRRLLEELEGSGLDALRSRVERAIAADEETQDLEFRWRGSQGRTEYGPEATLLNAELCRALSALDENLASTSKALGEDGCIAKCHQAWGSQSREGVQC